jgi:LmbE family N-acetylglucosaminyl deacetylase
MIIIPKKIVVISPHPDDETLGAGGLISRFAKEGSEVSILVVSGHLPPIYDSKVFDISQSESELAFHLMGVKRSEFLKIPATMVHLTAISDLNRMISSFIKKINPEMVLIPFPDRHIDHRTIFDASLVACRPNYDDAPKTVLAYETLSETHWNAPGIEPVFAPDFFVDISRHIEVKRDALNCYASQINNAPSRSIDASLALSRFRGSQNGCIHAEAFKVIRIII